MKILLVKIALLIFLSPVAMWAKDYNASLFGIKSDGITLNTKSIQKAIDFIHEKGGGKLDFSVGRYLTGTIRMKTNVQIELKEGAVLVGTTSIHDYVAVDGKRALIVAEGQDHIGVFGKGVIEGQGAGLFEALNRQIQKGYLTESPAQATAGAPPAAASKSGAAAASGAAPPEASPLVDPWANNNPFAKAPAAGKPAA